MEEKRYMISEASEKTGIETYALRYWEEELGLDIPRNEMGHRYYTDKQLQLFKQIKELKNSGFQLKAVRTVLDGSEGGEAGENPSVPVNVCSTDSLGAADETSAGVQRAEERKSLQDVAVLEGNEAAAAGRADKLAQFEQIIGDIVTRSLIANNPRLGEDISCIVSEQVGDKVIKEMDYMMRVREEAEDERYKKLDETIRGIQRSSREAAVHKDKQAKKRHRLFKQNQ